MKMDRCRTQTPHSICVLFSWPNVKAWGWILFDCQFDPKIPNRPLLRAGNPYSDARSVLSFRWKKIARFFLSPPVFYMICLVILVFVFINPFSSDSCLIWANRFFLSFTKVSKLGNDKNLTHLSSFYFYNTSIYTKSFVIFAWIFIESWYASNTKKVSS